MVEDVSNANNTEQTSAMPLKAAYSFGRTHKLEKEVGVISEMEIEWDSSYDSTVRRGYIVDLFERHDLMTEFIASHWPYGALPKGQTLLRRYQRIKKRFEDCSAGISTESPIVEELEEIVATPGAALMEFKKSTRHSKITGDFGEHLTLYWLSKYAFECARVDHTGIDIIASHLGTKEVMGISVKSRSRLPGKETETVTIQRTHMEKVEAACRAFNCEPHYSIVVDRATTTYLFILSDKTLRTLFALGKTIEWRMTDDALAEYRNNPAITMAEFELKTLNWSDQMRQPV